jgi:hypothetical protein
MNMSDSNRRPITQADCDVYNRNMPSHLQAELGELEWCLVGLDTYPMAKRKPPQWTICDRNYWEKSHVMKMEMARSTPSPRGKAEQPCRPARDPNARYDENGYRITSDDERDAYLNNAGIIRG